MGGKGIIRSITWSFPLKNVVCYQLFIWHISQRLVHRISYDGLAERTIMTIVKLLTGEHFPQTNFKNTWKYEFTIYSKNCYRDASKYNGTFTTIPVLKNFYTIGISKNQIAI